MDKLEKYLVEFTEKADQWFSGLSWYDERFTFFKSFFDQANLARAEWKDFQEMGDHLHSFNSYSIAKKKALGNPNHPVEHYRQVFEYLIRGTDSIDIRINNILDNKSSYYLKFFGTASLSELIAYAFSDNYVTYNKRDIQALTFLGINVAIESGDRFGNQFIKYNQAVKVVVERYTQIAGKRTNTTIPLEVDQFFSWLYVTYISKIADKSEIYLILNQFLNQAQTDNLKKKGFPTTIQKLDVKVSFGAGNLARIPWIALLKEPNTVTEGIYPVYLYYKEDNILILAYGVSETTKSTAHWPNAENLQTIENWYLANIGRKPDRYGSSFIKAVYNLLDDLIPEEVQNDLNELIKEYNYITFEGKPLVLEDSSPSQKLKKYWIIAPGEGAFKWDEFYTSGVIGIGWDLIGDLSQYSSRDLIRDELLKYYPEGSKSKKNNSLALWEFSREIQIGDILIPKRGMNEYLGYGVVESDYYFDPEQDNYKHLRKVKWVKNGSWPEDLHNIVVKTLTDITKYPEYVDRLRRLIGIEQDAVIPEKINYWWLNANPKYWRIEDSEKGQEQTYTTHNEKGNKRIRFEYFHAVKPGDLVIGYESSPIRKVVAIFEINKSVFIDEYDGEEKISFTIQEFLSTPVKWDDLLLMPELRDCEVLKNNQGSLFKLSKEEYTAIIKQDGIAKIEGEEYTKDQALRELFMDEVQLDSIIWCLENKKNIILQGPPGTGKTFMARRLAYLLMEEKDESKTEMIQFHQSYSYEDFIQGYRPKEDGTFKLENGVFYRFCKKAQVDPGNDYFFIIDEINRGNLSKIFGELMLLIEVDKRGEKNGVTLTYAQGLENKFYIPENVHIIGTMNTADRSLALVDYALRRRFSFHQVLPTYNTKFKKELIDKGVDEGIVEKICLKIGALNEQIEKDGNLGRGFKIGHSYFCNVPGNGGDEDWYKSIIEHEIAPLIEEYWFDKGDKADYEKRNLLS